MSQQAPRKKRPVSERVRELLARRLAARPGGDVGPPLTGFRAVLARVLGSFFGAGLLPKAPGTWGSLAALVIYVPVRHLGLDDRTFGCLLLFLLFSMASLALARDAERTAQQKDPRWFVLDEMAGVFLALFGLAKYNFAFAGLAFLLFRLFDALKIGAVGWVERRFGGAVGILLDDWVAAACANLPVRGLALVLVNFGVISASS
jgi:phosphatidylglycerophosphatase A